jgi:intraflagellar transport protein 56
VALCCTGQWAEAVDAFLSVSSDKFRGEYSYHAWLARAFIMSGRARDAWELYVKMDTTPDSVRLHISC